MFPEPRPFLETLFGSETSAETKEQQAQAAVLDSLPADVRRSFRYVALFDQMQRGQAMLMMPYELEIK